jgi:mono/diheme cytochrome c family protein
MKKRNVFAGLVLAFVCISVISMAEGNPKNEKITYKMPKKVKAVFENNCYGCHNNDSRNDKAKDKLNFDTLDELSKVKKVGTFSHITKVLDEGKMPPEKFLASHPDKKLTPEQVKILSEWVKKEADSLVKK